MPSDYPDHTERAKIKEKTSMVERARSKEKPNTLERVIGANDKRR